MILATCKEYIFPKVYGPKVYIVYGPQTMGSVKPFKPKNRDKIDLHAPKLSLKKAVIEIFERQPNL